MAAAVIPQLDYARFSKNGEIFLAAGVVIILFVMLVPLPTFFLDFMLCVSISISLLVLVTTMFMTSPLEFTIFPSLLLVTTLLRLALNVASTRLILLNGNMGANAAGEVIRAFGQFVVGGSYVVGAVIFMILFILNKTVITAGTTRIAEVAARFTLDAMPGKQMAIEADLNAGLLDEEQANARRAGLRKEADFYGAMLLTMWSASRCDVSAVRMSSKAVCTVLRYTAMAAFFWASASLRLYQLRPKSSKGTVPLAP